MSSDNRKQYGSGTTITKGRFIPHPDDAARWGTHARGASFRHFISTSSDAKEGGRAESLGQSPGNRRGHVLRFIHTEVHLVSSDA